RVRRLLRRQMPAFGTLGRAERGLAQEEIRIAREVGERRCRCGVARARDGLQSVTDAEAERLLVVVCERHRRHLEARCGERFARAVLVQLKRILELLDERKLAAEGPQPLAAPGR